MNDFSIGLQVTALGMGLVFLTLIMVMLAIIALDRVFRPRAHAAEETAPAAMTAGARPVGAAPAADSIAEVAAISVAIAAAMAERAGTSFSSPRARSANPLFAMHEGEDDLPGEVVLVATVDQGSGVWARAGRLRAMS